MTKQKIPTMTVDFIKYLKNRNPDKFELYEKNVGTPDYWKRAGIIEMIREVENIIKKQGV